VAPRSEVPKLISRVINFELVQPVCPPDIDVADGRTDGQKTYDSNTTLALRASRGKSDVIAIHKRHLSSNKPMKQKYLLVSHSKTKLSSEVSIILANINE